MVLSYKLDEAQIEKVQADLEKQGISLVGDSGEIDHAGCKIQYSYDKTSGTLLITVLHHPWVVSDEFVKNKIDGWFSAESA